MLDERIYEEGNHSFGVTSFDLPVGLGEYELIAEATLGSARAVHTGVFRVDEEILNDLPLAHTLIQGVDVATGQLTHVVSDVAIPARGPNLDMLRSYSSVSGNELGSLGRGWSNSLDQRVVQSACGRTMVVGAAGGSAEFREDGLNADGTVRFKGLKGSFATLKKDSTGYDFFALDGTRYRFDTASGARESGVRLTFIEDLNSNRLTYTYRILDGVARVSQVSDSAGRALNLSYTLKNFELRQLGQTRRESAWVLDTLAGPEDLTISYRYDLAGNLSAVEQRLGTLIGFKQSYGYTDFGSAIYQAPAGPTVRWLGYRLTRATDDNRGAETTYRYIDWTDVIRAGTRVVQLPTKRLDRVSLLDGGATTFAYGVLQTDVLDARSTNTVYRFNTYGAVEQETQLRAPLPDVRRQTVWDLVSLKPRRLIDRLGRTTDLSYDLNGNVTEERIQLAALPATLRTAQYFAPSEFERPIKNLTSRSVDGRGAISTYRYDARGRQLERTLGGISETMAYAVNGDTLTQTDGSGALTRLGYDTHGNLNSITDALNNVTRRTYDTLSREIRTTDALGRIHTTRYDAQSRTVERVDPIGSTRTEYLDGVRRLIDTDELGRIRRRTFDRMERLVLDQKPELVDEIHRYNAAGDKTQTVDGRGVLRSFQYDPDGALLSACEAVITTPLAGCQRHTLRTLDLESHPLVEVMSSKLAPADDIVLSTTTRTFNHPQYAQTSEEVSGLGLSQTQYI